MPKNDKNALVNADKIIERFGGIRPMAHKIDVPVTTVQGWKKRGVIPGPRRALIEQAAQSNDIRLDDLLQTVGIANENKLTEEPQKEKPKSSISSSEDKILEKNSQTRTQPTASKVEEKENRNHDFIMAEIKASEEKAVKNSIWATTILLLILAGLAGFLFWPASQKIGQQEQKIEQLEGQVDTLNDEVRDVNKRASFIRDLVPEDVQEKLTSIQEQAENLETTVSEISEKAEKFAGAFDADAGTFADRLSLIEEQFSGMEEAEGFTGLINRLQNLEQTIGGQGQLVAAMAELQTIVDGLDLQVASLDERLVAAQTEEGALGQTLEGVSGTDIKAAAMLIAFSQFRDSLGREEPFEEDLAILQKMVGADDKNLQLALTHLAPQAQSGVLTSGGLANEFKTLAGDIVVSSLKGENLSIAEQARARLGTILQVEKDGELVGGTQTQATVTKAQSLLDTGDIEGAITELQALEGNAAQTAQPFIEQAENTILAQQVETLLRQTILLSVSGGLPLPQVGNNLPNIQQGIQPVLPGQSVVQDPESGVSILPRQQGFKGFSTERP